MRLTSAEVRPGSDVYIYLEINAQGDERSTSATISWDPSVMTIDGTSGININPDVQPGPDGTDGQLLGVNGLYAGDGYLGLLIDFSRAELGSLGASGRRSIVRLTFHTLPGVIPVAGTSIELTDLLVPRQTVDIRGDVVVIDQSSPGSVIIPRPGARDRVPLRKLFPFDSPLTGTPLPWGFETSLLTSSLLH